MSRWILFSLLACLAEAGQVHAAPAEAPVGPQFTVVRDEWGILTIQGKRVGFLNVTTSKRAGPDGEQWKTESYQKMRLQRMGTALEVESRSTVLEDAAGKIINFRSRNSSAGTDVEVRGYRSGEELVVISREVRQTYPYDAGMFAPAALDRKVRGMPMREGETLSGRMFSAEYPQKPVDFKTSVLKKENKTISGTELELWKTATTLSILPGVEISAWVDDQGDAKWLTFPIPGLGDIDHVMASREEAMKALEAVELFSPSLIEPDKPLARHKTLRRAVYRVRSKDGRPFSLWSGPGHTVTEERPGSYRVEVLNPPEPPPAQATTLPWKPDPETVPYLSATPYLEVDAPEIRELARKAVGDETDALKAARRIETEARRHITQKHLGVGFATALETARSRAGDCTEHAVLAAALGRAVGLPTRVVSGLGYLPADFAGAGAGGGKGVFGFHMWTEAQVAPGVWVPLDPALNGYDVGHLAISKTALAEASPLVELSIPMLHMMSNLEIEILETE